MVTDHHESDRQTAYHAAVAVRIDDIPCDVGGDTLGDVLGAAGKRLGPAGRVIVEVVIDGESLVGESLATRQGESAAGMVIELTSADPKELALGLLEQVRRRLDEAATLQTDAAACLQRDDEADAMKQLGEAVVIWQQTQQAVQQSAAMMNVPLSELAGGDATFEELTRSLIEQLQSLRDGLTARDTVAVADTLAYEWPATTQRWRGVVERLMEKIDA